MVTQKPDSPKPIPAPEPVPAPRSDALEAELGMLEAILPPELKQPVPVDPPKDRRRGDAQ